MPFSLYDSLQKNEINFKQIFNSNTTKKTMVPFIKAKFILQKIDLTLLRIGFFGAAHL